MQDVNGLGLDATFDPANGFRAIPSYGWFVSCGQWWAKKWASAFTYGENESDLTASLPSGTCDGANYLSANIIWLPLERMGGRPGVPARVPQEQGRAEGRQHPPPGGVPVPVLNEARFRPG